MLETMADTIDWKKVRLPEEFQPITRIINKIHLVRHEARKEALLQQTRLFAAFDDLDWELARAFESHSRWDTERN